MNISLEDERWVCPIEGPACTCGAKLKGRRCKDTGFPIQPFTKKDIREMNKE
jgi:hypothetical protein